jgi:hypothetical protein
MRVNNQESPYTLLLYKKMQQGIYNFQVGLDITVTDSVSIFQMTAIMQVCVET